MSIQDIPLELMRLMVAACSRGELASMQRTCRHLRRIIEPLLYEEVEWEFPKPATAAQKPPLHLLLRTLLYRPELGCHMRRISLTELGSIQSVWLDHRVPKLELKELERLASRGIEVTNSQSERWLEEVKKGNHEAFVILLLSCCPSVQYLTLHNDFCRTWSWNKTSDAPNHETLWKAILNLQKLKEIDCDKNGQMPIPWKSDRIASLLRLPEIQSIKISTQESEIKAGSSLSNITCPTLKTLVLYTSLLTEETIGSLVATAPNLKSLRVDIERHLDPAAPEVGTSWIDCPKLLDTMFPKPTTGSPLEFLEELAISSQWGCYSRNVGDYSEGGPYPAEPTDIFPNSMHGLKGFFGSLREVPRLSRLKTLEVAPEMLLGWDPRNASTLKEVLPDSVSHVYFRCDFSGWEEFRWTIPVFTAFFENEEMVSSHGQGEEKKITFLMYKGEIEYYNALGDDGEYMSDLRKAVEDKGWSFEMKKGFDCEFRNVGYLMEEEKVWIPEVHFSSECGYQVDDRWTPR